MRLHKIKKKVSKYWGPRWIQNREESLAHKRLPCTIATTELCYKYHNQLLDADNQSKNSPSMSATSPFMSSASSCSLSFWKVASSSQRSRCRSTMQFLSTQYWTKLWKKKNHIQNETTVINGGRRQSRQWYFLPDQPCRLYQGEIQYKNIKHNFKTTATKYTQSTNILA